MPVETVECCRCHRYFLIAVMNGFDPMLPWLCSECRDKVLSGEIGGPIEYWLPKE